NVSRIWLAEVATGANRQLTQGPGSDRSPRWSPVGTTLAFLSTRQNGAQVWVLDLTGGDARRVSILPEGEGELSRPPDGKGGRGRGGEPGRRHRRARFARRPVAVAAVDGAGRIRGGSGGPDGETSEGRSVWEWARGGDGRVDAVGRLLHVGPGLEVHLRRRGR